MIQVSNWQVLPISSFEQGDQTREGEEKRTVGDRGRGFSAAREGEGPLGIGGEGPRSKLEFKLEYTIKLEYPNLNIEYT